MKIKYFFPLLLLLLLWFGSSRLAYAQTGNEFDPMKDDIGNNIPSLAVLIDSAISNNPYIQFRDLQIIVNTCKLKSSQVDWTKNIGFQSDLRYGNFYSYSTNSSGGIEPPAIASSHNDTKYGVALYVSLPFYTLVNRKNQIKIAKTEIDQAKSMAEVQRNEVRQLVIRQYNELVLKQNLLRIKSRYLETSRINMQMVEKEFSNGVLSVSEYARISETVSRTETDYENSRMDFLTAYMILEEIVGMNFYLTEQIPGTDDGN
jgi:outer membrane protein TolC